MDIKFKKLSSYLIFLCLISCAGGGYYATPKYLYDNYYSLTGRMDEKSYDAIIELIKNKPTQSIKILANSRGGYVAGILDAMDAIHKHGRVSWDVSAGSVCQSACAVLALSASKINGELDFHSVYGQYNKDKYMMLGNNDEIKNKLISFGYSQDLISKLFGSINIYKTLKFQDGVLSL